MNQLARDLTSRNQLLALGLVLLAAVSRLIGLPPNITAVSGATIFGAYAIRNPLLALAVPLLAMAIADSIISGLYPGIEYVYAGMIGTFLIARLLLRRFSYLRLVSATFLGSLWFFVISNFGVFVSGYYGWGWDGLVECYVAALPFWRNSLIGDFLSTGLIFFLYGLAKRHTFDYART